MNLEIEIINKIKEIKIKENELLIRISGVTQDVLKEQLSEEYYDLQQKNIMLESQLESIRNIIYTNIILSSENDLYVYYELQFKKEYDIISALERTNNIDIKKLLIINRIKPITDRRSMINFLTFYKHKLIVKNLENFVIEQIGNDELPALYLYNFTLSRENFLFGIYAVLN